MSNEIDSYSHYVIKFISSYNRNPYSDSMYTYKSLGICMSQRTLSEYTSPPIAHFANLSHSSGFFPYMDRRSSEFWYLDSSRSLATSLMILAKYLPFI